MGKLSLKTHLRFFIKNLGYATHSQVMGMVRQLNFRESNAERRLRELSEGEHAIIEKEMNGKAIIGYRWKGITLPPAKEKVSQEKLL